jgi:hypothetical protein
MPKTLSHFVIGCGEEVPTQRRGTYSSMCPLLCAALPLCDARNDFDACTISPPLLFRCWLAAGPRMVLRGFRILTFIPRCSACIFM